MKARESYRIGRAPSYAMPTNFLKTLPGTRVRAGHGARKWPILVADWGGDPTLANPAPCGAV